MRFAPARPWAIGLLAAALFLPLQNAAASTGTALDAPCAPLEVVFARGSGQSVEDGEANRLQSQLLSRLTDDSVMHWYELGSDAAGYGGHVYPAIDIGNVWNGRILGAAISGGYANAYGRSVDSGVGELYNYFLQRLSKCSTSGTKFAFAGYSQGAQVVGQTLEKLNTENPASLEYVEFSALFGDPKLHLPEGEGFNPPACRGKDLSPYRRTVPNCDTDNGSLGARKPYLASAMSSKAGLWCNNNDFFCGSSKWVWDQDGHSKYRDEGNGIDEAAREIISLVHDRLPADQKDGLDISIRLLGMGTTGIDVAFLIDTTGSMWGDIAAAKQFANTMADTIAALRGRVALVAFRDLGDEYTASIISGLNPDLTPFKSGLSSLSASGGGDTPEATLHALTTTLNGLEWRPGATKAAVVLTDAGFHEPDLVDGSTQASVALRSLQIDPVNVYPVVPSWVAPQYEELARLTSGQVIVNGGDTATALTTALTKISQRPVALLRLTEYFGAPGDSFTFDASSSYSTSSTIVKYEWDFEGDGTFDETTTSPVAEHVYPVAGENIVQVRVTDEAGLIANFSAPVHVGTTTPDEGPLPPKDLTASPGPEDGSLSLSWTPVDDAAGSWVVSVNGVAVGKTSSDTLTVTLTDLDLSQDVLLSVTAVDPEGLAGNPAHLLVQPPSGPSVENVDFDVIPPTVKSSQKGVLPVAILSSPTFDATQVDLATIRVAPMGDSSRATSTESHGRVHIEDVNKDGLADALLHYSVADLMLRIDDTEVVVEGMLIDGTRFTGRDSIVVRP